MIILERIDQSSGRTDLDGGDSAPLPLRDRYPPWGLRQCLLGVIAAIGAVLLLVAIVGIVAEIRGDRNTQSIPNLLTGLVATVGLEATLFGVAAGMTARRFRGGLGLLGWRMKPVPEWIGWSMLAVLLAWITLLAYAAIVHAVGLGDFGPKSNVPEGIFEHPQTVVLAVFLTVVAAPVCEETFFRGFLFNGLRRRLGFAAAASVSGVLFALAHLAGTLIIPFTVIGVIFAFTYRRTGTLWANVVTHMTFNLVSVIGALLTGGKS